MLAFMLLIGRPDLHLDQLCHLGVNLSLGFSDLFQVFCFGHFVNHFLVAERLRHIDWEINSVIALVYTILVSEFLCTEANIKLSDSSQAQASLVLAGTGQILKRLFINSFFKVVFE